MSSNLFDSDSLSTATSSQNSFEMATEMINSLEVKTLRSIAIRAYTSIDGFSLLIDEKYKHLAETRDSSLDARRGSRNQGPERSERTNKRVRLGYLSPDEDDLEEDEEPFVGSRPCSKDTEVSSVGNRLISIESEVSSNLSILSGNLGDQRLLPIQIPFTNTTTTTQLYVESTIFCSVLTKKITFRRNAKPHTGNFLLPRWERHQDHEFLLPKSVR